MSDFRAYWRSRFPPTGAAYELFDAAVFLFALAVVGYILTSPTPTQEKALSAPLDLLPDYVWGTALALVSLLAIACSYRPRRVRLGYRAMIYACTFWSANFAVGIALYGASIRSVISVMLYGWIVSRLVRDMPREIEA